MSSEDVIRKYGRHLSQYEKEEILTFKQIYYLNLACKRKGIGQFIEGELTCQDENPDKNEDPNGIYNHGFDND